MLMFCFIFLLGHNIFGTELMAGLYVVLTILVVAMVTEFQALWHVVAKSAC
jgi:hypothetical protein